MIFRKSLLASSLMAVCLSAAAQWETLPDAAPSPENNPMSEAKVELGKALFMDPRFSKDGNISCNSCHNIMAGGDDNRPNSIGFHDQRGGRGAPTVWNAAFQSVQFWDGRAATLEDQAKGPVANPIEMGMESVDAAMLRVKAIPGYAQLFKLAFPDDKEAMMVDNAAKAVGAFERTLITPNSPYDKYVKGDKAALTEQQVKGMNTFSELGCTACHSGVNFSGPKMEIGQGFFMKFPTFPDTEYDKKYQFSKDLGRYEVSKNDADKNMFRVPTLRNIALTAPYFHNGAVATLQEAIKVMAKTQLNKDLTDEQVADLEAFLNALTGEFPTITMPRLPATPGFSVIGIEGAGK